MPYYIFDKYTDGYFMNKEVGTQVQTKGITIDRFVKDVDTRLGLKMVDDYLNNYKYLKVHTINLIY